MADIIIIKIIFGIFLSVSSIVLILLSFILYYKYLVQEKRCVSKTKGIVKRYTPAGRGGIGIHLPVVFYTVNGKKYKVVGPEYKRYKIIDKRDPFGKNTLECTENNQVLTIHRTSNAFIGIHSGPMKQLYPINSEIDVYYDPKKPKVSYVLRYCNRKWLFWFMFVTSLFVLLLDIIILVIL